MTLRPKALPALAIFCGTQLPAAPCGNIWSRVRHTLAGVKDFASSACQQARSPRICSFDEILSVGFLDSLFRVQVHHSLCPWWHEKRLMLVQLAFEKRI